MKGEVKLFVVARFYSLFYFYFFFGCQVVGELSRNDS